MKRAGLREAAFLLQQALPLLAEGTFMLNGKIRQKYQAEGKAESLIDEGQPNE